MFSVIALKSQETQVGIASFYHQKFHGRKTANGHHLNNDSYTCAHRTLPLGTKVEITNLNNGKYVIATVNDRGPYARNRIIDVTQQIAKDLDFLDRGIAKVQIKVIKGEPLWYVIKASDSAQFANRFGVKIGSFTNYAEAALVAKKLKECCGAFVNLGRTTNAGKAFLLVAGNFATAEEAKNLLNNFPHKIKEPEIISYNQILETLK
ncbi:MAG: septal ring lytic transglycosylase RlpA family protein [Chitinophagales bacterium]|nr:septal ring lytic transglycosylase RlpA family protein [Chitinophagales bacterium]MCO5281636.1 septal ring lytic transglycosylase RlpA family protein [Chitinophagales bacterium]